MTLTDFIQGIISLYKLLHFTGNSVTIATGYGLDGTEIGVRVQVGSRFSLLHVVQTGSVTHPASYPKVTGGSFRGSKGSDTSS
jgi:hypothetical protein